MPELKKMTPPSKKANKAKVSNVEPLVAHRDISICLGGHRGQELNAAFLGDLVAKQKDK
jgi:hypothetical protein